MIGAGIVAAGFIMWSAFGGSDAPTLPASTGPDPAPTTVVVTQGAEPSGSAQPSPSGEPETSAPASVDPSPTTVPDLGDFEGDAAAAAPVAERAILAYTSTTWRDSAPSDWVARMRPFTTGSYQREIEGTYGRAESDLAFQQMVADKVDYRTSIDSIDLTSFYEPKDGQITLVVTYYRSTRTGDGAWTEPEYPLSKFVDMTRNADGKWRVSGIRDTSDRSQ